MPRNDQVTRQWHLLRLLGSSRWHHARRYHRPITSDTPRTLLARSGSSRSGGIPILNERRDGRVRWRLMDGFRHVPALSFSPTELMALVMSRTLLKPLAGTQIQAALESAMTRSADFYPRIARLCPARSKRVCGWLGLHKTYRQHRETIDRLTQAIDKQRTIQVRYFSASRGREDAREIDPYRLWNASGGSILSATATCARSRECSSSSASNRWP